MFYVLRWPCGLYFDNYIDFLVKGCLNENQSTFKQLLSVYFLDFPDDRKLVKQKQTYITKAKS